MSALVLGILLQTTGAPLAEPSTAEGWRLAVRTRDEISVYRRERAGSPIEEVMGTCVIAAPAARAFAAAMREDTYKELRRRTEEYRTIHTAGDDTWFVYQRVRHPLIARRDLTLRYDTASDERTGRLRISWRIANAQGPPPLQGVVRVEDCAGELLFEPLAPGATRVRYRQHTDPGGRIPHWVVDRVSRAEVPTLLRALRAASVAAGGR